MNSSLNKTTQLDSSKDINAETVEGSNTLRKKDRSKKMNDLIYMHIFLINL